MSLCLGLGLLIVLLSCISSVSASVSDNLFICSPNSNDIVKYSMPSASVLNEVSFNDVSYIDNYNSYIYAVSGAENEIRVYDSSLSLQNTFPTNLSNPTRINVLPDYILISSQYKLSLWDRNTMSEIWTVSDFDLSSEPGTSYVGRATIYNDYVFVSDSAYLYKLDLTDGSQIDNIDNLNGGWGVFEYSGDLFIPHRSGYLYCADPSTLDIIGTQVSGTDGVVGISSINSNAIVGTSKLSNGPFNVYNHSLEIIQSASCVYSCSSISVGNFVYRAGNFDSSSDPHKIVVHEKDNIENYTQHIVSQDFLANADFNKPVSLVFASDDVQDSEISYSGDNFSLVDFNVPDSVNRASSMDYSFVLKGSKDNVDTVVKSKIIDSNGISDYSVEFNVVLDNNELNEYADSVSPLEPDNYTIKLYTADNSVIASKDFEVTIQVYDIEDLPDKVSNWLNIDLLVSQLLLSSIVIISVSLLAVAIVGKTGANISDFSLLLGFVDFPVMGFLIVLGWLPIWVPVMVVFVLLVVLATKFKSIGGD